MVVCCRLSANVGPLNDCQGGRLLGYIGLEMGCQSGRLSRETFDRRMAKSNRSIKECSSYRVLTWVFNGDK